MGQFVRTGWITACLLVAMSSVGCGPAWVYTFNEAERIARPKEQPILLFYRDHLDVRSARINEALEQPETMRLIEGYVPCSLISAYDPNRRYVAQYGVLAPPALIVIHPDGTYHALQDVDDPVKIRAFISSAKPPGLKPSIDQAIPRPTDFLIRAEGTYETAVDLAQRQNRKMMILYKWWLDADSNELITRMSRPEIASRCTETINCVLDWDFTPNRKHVAKYGVTKFPTIIVVHQDGSFQKREGLGNVQEIASFLSTALSSQGGQRPGARPPRPQSSSPQASRPPTTKPQSPISRGPTPDKQPPAATSRSNRPPKINWLTIHDQARIRAQREGRGLFVFYEKALDETSMRMSNLLDSSAARTILSDTVNCRLNEADQSAASTMRLYGVTHAPAFVAVRPDGTSRARRGSLTITDLRRLRAFIGTP